MGEVASLESRVMPRNLALSTGGILVPLNWRLGRRKELLLLLKWIRTVFSLEILKPLESVHLERVLR